MTSDNMAGFICFLPVFWLWGIFSSGQEICVILIQAHRLAWIKVRFCLVFRSILHFFFPFSLCNFLFFRDLYILQDIHKILHDTVKFVPYVKNSYLLLFVVYSSIYCLYSPGIGKYSRHGHQNCRLFFFEDLL